MAVTSPTVCVVSVLTLEKILPWNTPNNKLMTYFTFMKERYGRKREKEMGDYSQYFMRVFFFSVLGKNRNPYFFKPSIVFVCKILNKQ